MPFQSKEIKTHDALLNFYLFALFFYCVSRSGDGTQDLHLRHSFRTGQVDAADGGQEVQVERAAPDPLPLRPLLHGEHRCHSKLVFPHAHQRHLAPSLCCSCRATSTGKGRSWRGTCSRLPSGSGRGRPSSTWGIRAASPWWTSSTPRDRWQSLPGLFFTLLKSRNSILEMKSWKLKKK